MSHAPISMGLHRSEALLNAIQKADEFCEGVTSGGARLKQQQEILANPPKISGSLIPITSGHKIVFKKKKPKQKIVSSGMVYRIIKGKLMLVEKE